MSSPLAFFAKLPPGIWYEEAMSFAGISAWMLAFFGTLLVFITQYWPIGKTLVAGISGFKLLIVSPVALVLAFMFFMMTFIIAGGIFMALFIFTFYVLGWLLHFLGIYFKGKADPYETIKASFYSSAVILTGVLLILISFVVKKNILNFKFFVLGYNVLFLFAVLYLYGLQAIILRKLYRIDKWKAFAGAAVIAVILIMILIVSNKIIVPRLAPFVS